MRESLPGLLLIVGLILAFFLFSRTREANGDDKEAEERTKLEQRFNSTFYGTGWDYKSILRALGWAGLFILFIAAAIVLAILAK